MQILIEALGGALFVGVVIAGAWNGTLPASMVPGSAVPFLGVK